MTKYLLDTQPNLTLVLAETTGSDTTRYIHSLRGIHMIQDASDNWHSVNLDGLGSVRNVVDGAGEVISAHNYIPYGVPDSSMTGFAFTGEQRDSNGLQYHRARYYAPELGLWANLDPLETENRYGYVGGNVVNATDANGLCVDPLTCYIASTIALAGLALLLGGCTTTPTPINPTTLPIGSITDEQVEQATVTILTCDTGVSGKKCDSTMLSSLPDGRTWFITSLGTITSKGVVTHDHFSASATGLNQAEPGAGAREPAIAKRALTSWGCIVITGRNGRYFIEGAKLDVDDTYTTQGALLIKSTQTDASGTPVSLTNLGLTVNETSNWQPVKGAIVKIPYIYGDNLSPNITKHNESNDILGVRDFSISQTTTYTNVSTGRTVYTTDPYKTVASSYFLEGDRHNEGDSGGGVFSADGSLVGVVHFISAWDNEPFLASSYATYRIEFTSL